MNLSLKDKHALVCGSTQGIGKAVAMELARMECNVTLVARNETALQQTLKELSNNGKQTHDYISADFNFPEQLKEKIEKYIKEKGSVHILVNNTGGPKSGPIVTAETDEFIKTFNAHLICNHILMQACLEGMKKENYGRIVNIISTSVKLPLKNLGVSNTIRAAVGNWSKTLANEVAKFGITVNNVLPGATNTSRLKQIINDKSVKTGKSVDEIAKEMMSEIPSGRFGEPEEIANAVAFLASPAAGYINGINVPVDGGGPDVCNAIYYPDKKLSMNKDVLKYNSSLASNDKAICNFLAEEIESNLPEAENKVWHAHPVWFLNGNPVVGYSKQKAGIRLMFWSGMSFDEEALKPGTGKFMDASVIYNSAAEIKLKDLKRWCTKAKKIQWDYKNIVKRKGKLERLV